jgi:hypothetical protein
VANINDGPEAEWVEFEGNPRTSYELTLRGLDASPDDRIGYSHQP